MDSGPTHLCPRTVGQAFPTVRTGWVVANEKIETF